MELDAAIVMIRTDVMKTGQPTCWADLGCGSGLFTLALSHLVAAGSIIYAMDRDAVALKSVSVRQQVAVQTLQEDFTQFQKQLPLLDGVVMANSLHYVRQQAVFIRRLSRMLKPGGAVILVEYDTTAADAWVPYPLPFNSARTLFLQNGFTSFTGLARRASAFRAEGLYSAAAVRE